MRVRRSSNQAPAVVQMGPLIDCIFLLLIFFIVIAVTKKSVKELGIQLPEPRQAVSKVKPKDKHLLIRVTQDGKLYVEDSQVQQQGMLSAIREAKSEDPNKKVRFQIDERAQFSDLYPVLDQLKHYGLTDWSFQVKMQQ